MLASAPERQSLRQPEFEIIRAQVHKLCGINLAGKQMLVEARLGNRLPKLGFTSFRDYCQHILQNPSGAVFLESVDLLTTNHTSFFREDQHFTLLSSTILPSFKDQPPAIWSAACSSGEEPYSIALTLLNSLDDALLKKCKILATDLSTRVLAKARKALYPLDAAQNIPEPLRRKYLLKGKNQFLGRFLLRPEVQAMVEFRRFNLLDDLTGLGPFDVIFCRNVMIYFDAGTQADLVQRLTARLKPGGFLLVGHAESIHAPGPPLQAIAPATYQKRTPLLSRKRSA